MNRIKKIAIATFVLIFVLAVPANAAGNPGAHGLDGRDFGAAVSVTAQSSPGALADHASSKAQGKPAAHGISGRQFGQAVKSLANSYPGAISDHVK